MHSERVAAHRSSLIPAWRGSRRTGQCARSVGLCLLRRSAVSAGKAITSAANLVPLAGPSGGGCEGRAQAAAAARARQGSRPAGGGGQPAAARHPGAHLQSTKSDDQCGMCRRFAGAVSRARVHRLKVIPRARHRAAEAPMSRRARTQGASKYSGAWSPFDRPALRSARCKSLPTVPYHLTTLARCLGRHPELRCAGPAGRGPS